MASQNRQSKTFYGSLFVLVFGALLLWFATLANSPDRDLRLVREVPSVSKPEVLQNALNDLKQWPNWFHDLQEVQPQQADNPLAVGSRLKLIINSKKTPWSRFELTADVIESTPGRVIGLRIVEDSKGKLTHLFDRLEWRVELLNDSGAPAGATAVVRGTCVAHTAHWRARVFGAIAERIMLHQIFYPDMIKLAELKQPSAQN